MKKYLTCINYVDVIWITAFLYGVYLIFNNESGTAVYVITVSLFFSGVSILVTEIRKIPNVTINMNGKTEIKYGKGNEH